MRAARLVAGAILLVLCALQGLALLRSPPMHMPARIDIQLAPGAAAELGRDALAVPGSGAGLRLRRDEHGRWWAASADGALRLERAGRQTRSSSMVLAPGARFHLGAQHYTVDAVDGQAVRFSDGRQAWRYDGASVWRDGELLAACPGAGPGARLAGAWNRWLPRLVPVLAIERPLGFGGNLSCGTQVGNAHAEPGSAVLRIVDGAPLLTAATGSRRTPLLVERGGLPFELALAEQALDGVSAITIGRTRMATDLRDGALQLHPTSRVAVRSEARAALPEGVRWQWERRDPWAWPAWATPFAIAAVAAGALAFAMALRTRVRGKLPDAARLGAGIALAVAGLAMLLAQRAGAAPGVAWSLLLCWGALWYGLAWRGAGAVVACGVLLLAAGLLLQLELGLGAPDTSWLRHFQKTAAVIALGMGSAGAFASRRRVPGGIPMIQARAESLLLLLAACALAALLLQVGWGNETGVFDLQPVEFAKLALTALAAHCIALGLGGRTGTGSAGALLRWLRLAAPALLFVVLLGVALVQVDDYSPLILLLVWGAAMLLAWSFAARRPGAALAVAAMAWACLAMLMVLRGAAVDGASGWSFYGERFGVWLDPAAHPHTGQQLLLGAAAITGGGWFGADGIFGLTALGQGAFEALAIPAVQDDFAPSFLLQRHGLIAGLALWTLQAAFLCALLHAALRAWQGAVLARDFRHAWAGRFRCFVLCGGAAFLFGHFLLSWGTNLAFFPIMGQPMSFLSAGGSHLLFFIFPLLAFAAAGAPVDGGARPIIEEN
ncbi:FtsW/RodA/SpoVE family cell cycle protein [Massilia niabensis]|uniref:Probable peptidoglycan glycosyltransferase FtsW n=1 Tax=Massilia niabensis TaxID=544910 RepID=A0ABW0L1L6_9BURK